MIRHPSSNLTKDISGRIQEAKGSGSILELRTAVLQLHKANKDDNIALEDIAKLVTRAATANGVAMLLNNFWDVERDQPKVAM